MEPNSSHKEDLQVKYLKKQLFLMRLMTIFTAAMFGCVFYLMVFFVPKVNSTIASLQNSAQNLEEISEELQEAEIGKLVKDLDKLIETSEGTIGSANEKLNKIDFETLNKSIQDLSNIISPLSKLFGGRN